MYNFRDLNITAAAANNSLRGLIFNGTDLDSIPGFRAIAINGRGVSARKVNSIEGMSGELFDYSAMKSRDIEVIYILASGSDDELRNAYSLLSKIMNVQGEKKIEFKDQPGWYFEGSLSEASEPKEVSNTVIGTLTFHCSKPFKYSGVVDVFPQISITYNQNDHIYKLMAEFRFTPISGAESVMLTNSLGDSIVIGPVTAGKEIKISLMMDKIEVYESGIRKMYLLGISSGVEKFRVQAGAVYSMSNHGNLAASFVEVRL